MSLETAPQSGRLHSAIDETSVRITIHQIAQEVKISAGSVKTIIHDHFHMHKVSARWIPRLLTPFHK